MEMVTIQIMSVNAVFTVAILGFLWNLHRDIAGLRERMARMEERMDRFEGRMERVEERMERVESLLEGFVARRLEARS